MEQDPRGFFPPGDLRASDAERDLAVSELGRAFSAGRLTTEEFEERSGQASAAKTGNQLAALLADLPIEREPAAPAVARRADLAPARPRIVVGGTIAAVCFALVAVANAVSPGPTLQQRQAAWEFFRQHGYNYPLPPASGFNWPGTITPAVISILFVVLVLVVRSARARRGQH